MEEQLNERLKLAFTVYKSTVWEISTDIQYWQSFLKWAIKEYQEKSNYPDLLFEAGFCVYDVDYSTQSGLLKSHNKTFTIYKSELEDHRQDFINWVMNFSIIKAYNAVELFFLEAIKILFFPDNQNSENSKRNIDKLQKGIKEYLLENNCTYDTKNNRHIIEFLKANSSSFSMFLLKPIRVDLETNWSYFFELFSILRNIISHQRMIVNMDALNEIKSKSKDIFDRHFELVEDSNGFMSLHPKESVFLGFLFLINEFSLNTVKNIARQPNLDFLDMR